MGLGAWAVLKVSADCRGLVSCESECRVGVEPLLMLREVRAGQPGGWASFQTPIGGPEWTSGLSKSAHSRRRSARGQRSLRPAGPQPSERRPRLSRPVRAALHAACSSAPRCLGRLCQES